MLYKVKFADGSEIRTQHINALFPNNINWIVLAVDTGSVPFEVRTEF